MEEQHNLPEKQFLKIDVTGQSHKSWQQFREKLLSQIGKLLDTVVDTDQGVTVKDEAKYFMSAMLDYAKSNLARPGLENDKLEAEVIRLFTQSEVDRAEARKKNAEAAAQEFETRVRQLRFVLGIASAFLVGEEGKEAIVFGQQIDLMVQAIDELEMSDS